MRTLSQQNVLNVKAWLDENEKSFVPPVCNKLMHNEQLIIMFVGGPNQREDYHIEEGEELFYQLKGDMCVKIIENGQHKDVHIRQGEFFLLPARVPHSPQRTANSIGLVIERRRLPNETDGVRWMVPKTTDPLYEKWFHCKDLGSELGPLIKQYFASDEFKTKIPGENVLERSQVPFTLNPVVLKHEKHGPFNLLDKITAEAGDEVDLSPAEIGLQFQVSALKKGEHQLAKLGPELDCWLWQIKGSSQVKVNTTGGSQSLKLSAEDSVLISEQNLTGISISIADEDAILLKVVQDPARKYLASN